MDKNTQLEDIYMPQGYGKAVVYVDEKPAGVAIDFRDERKPIGMNWESLEHFVADLQLHIDTYKPKEEKNNENKNTSERSRR